jgi:hypothetical protein
MCYDKNGKLGDLIGKTLTGVINSGDEILFILEGGKTYRMHHDQDCCESVTIEDVVGELTDLIGSPILMAEEVSNAEDPGPKDKYDESYTWIFYKLATVKGYVTIRWYGTSNGYYGEGVDFHEA